MPWMWDASARTNICSVGLRDAESSCDSGNSYFSKRGLNLLAVSFLSKPFRQLGGLPCSYGGSVLSLGLSAEGLCFKSERSNAPEFCGLDQPFPRNSDSARCTVGLTPLNGRAANSTDTQRTKCIFGSWIKRATLSLASATLSQSSSRIPLARRFSQSWSCVFGVASIAIISVIIYYGYTRG